MNDLHLEPRVLRHVDVLMERHPVLTDLRPALIDACGVLTACFLGGGKLLIAGNGGSAADAEHIVGELMKSFVLPRDPDAAFSRRLAEADAERGPRLAAGLQRGLPAIALHNHNSLNTAFLNDVDGLLIYAQQVFGYGRPGDVFLGITTSGNAENILNAAVTARAMGMKTVALTGRTGGKLAAFSDVALRAPETETYKVQELHLPLYHCLCLMVEDAFFGRETA